MLILNCKCMSATPIDLSIVSVDFALPRHKYILIHIGLLWNRTLRICLGFFKFELNGGFVRYLVSRIRLDPDSNTVCHILLPHFPLDCSLR